jgi:DNA-binding SARP family transcriptional activator
MARGVAVNMLGPIEVRIDGRSLGPADFGGRKQKLVLEILLVHRGQPVAKERIAELLWGEHRPRDPMRTLEAYVSGLRAHLGADAAALIRRKPMAYRADLSAIDLDCAVFDRLVARADREPPHRRLEMRRAAVNIVRDELLADEPYATWAEPLRAVYAERLVTLTLDLAEDCAMFGDPEEAAQLAERVLAEHTVRERAYRTLMIARYADGEQDLALDAFRRCRTALAEELGTSPLPETQRVHLAVLRQEPVETITPRRAGARPRARHHGPGSPSAATRRSPTR